MYTDFYTSTPMVTTTRGVDGTWMIISAVLAIVGGIVGYMLFVSKKKKGNYSEFVSKLHDFLNFKILLIEVILKTTYIISALYITLSSFALIGTSVATFFLYLILGNLVLRLIYELLLMTITLVNNTTEINKKLK